MGVTPPYGFSVSAVPPPTKPAVSVPPRTGLPPPPVELPPEPVPPLSPQAAARRGDIPTIAPAAPRSSVPRDSRKASVSVPEGACGCFGSVTVSSRSGLHEDRYAHSRIRCRRGGGGGAATHR